MPVVGDENQVVIPIDGTPTGDMPHSFQRCFAQQCTSERDVLSIASINVARVAMERWVIHKYPVHSIDVAVKEAYL